MSFDNNTVCVNNICGHVYGSNLNTVQIDDTDSPYGTIRDNIVILADTTNGDVDINLQNYTMYPNQTYIIKKDDYSTNAVTIYPPVGYTVNNTTQLDLVRDQQVVQLLRVDTDWKIINDSLDLLLVSKGDILTHDGTNLVKLPVGLDGQVLISDSSSAEGLKWNTSVGGGEINTGVNVGTGIGKVFKTKIGPVLNFKSLTAGKNITIQNNTDDIIINNNYGYEIISTSMPTIPNPDISLTELIINTSVPTNVVLTLANPVSPVLGQTKTFFISNKTGTDNILITPATFVNATSILLTKKTQSLTLTWTSLGWLTTSGTGAQYV